MCRPPHGDVCRRRLRRSEPPRVSGDRGSRGLRRRAVPLGPVGSHGTAGRKADRRHRHRRQRNSAHAACRARGGPRRCVPAHAALDRPKLDRPISRAEQRLYATLPITQKALRGAIFAITEAVGVAITRYPRLLAIGERWSSRPCAARSASPGCALPSRRTTASAAKRILPSNDYYPALARDNVALVTDGIERITRRGVVTATASSTRLDVLVCSTGFEIEEVFMHLDICGRDGVTLTDTWANGIEAHRGTTVAGFPDLALLTRSQHRYRQHVAGVHDRGPDPLRARLLSRVRRHSGAAIEVRADAQRAYNGWLQERMQRTVWLRGGCSSWYLDSEGVNRTLYPGPSSSFWRSLRRVRVGGYELIPIRTPAPARHREPTEVPA